MRSSYCLLDPNRQCAVMLDLEAALWGLRSKRNHECFCFSRNSGSITTTISYLYYRNWYLQDQRIPKISSLILKTKSLHIMLDHILHMHIARHRETVMLFMLIHPYFIIYLLYENYTCWIKVFLKSSYWAWKKNYWQRHFSCLKTGTRSCWVRQGYLWCYLLTFSKGDCVMNTLCGLQ